MTPALLVDALAVYRLTRLLVRDELTRPVRERWLEPLLTRPVPDDHDGPALATPYGSGLPRVDLTARAAYLATCPWCLSVWLAAAVTVARRSAPDRWEPVAQALALAAGAGLLLDRDRS